MLFLQGCPLRCLYCHNPDTWSTKDGKEYDTDEIINDIVKYKKYMKLSGGGVTITGGEPMMQIDFVSDLIDKIKAEDIHVAIDTSGYFASEKALKVIEKSDLVLIDIKSFDSAAYKKLTGVALEPTLKTMNHLKKKNIDVWIRFVLVPGYTDDFKMIKEMSDYLSGFDNIKKIEVLPFHKMGEYKWDILGRDYKLKETQEPDEATIKTVIEILTR